MKPQRFVVVSGGTSRALPPLAWGIVSRVRCAGPGARGGWGFARQ